MKQIVLLVFVMLVASILVISCKNSATEEDDNLAWVKSASKLSLDTFEGKVQVYEGQDLASFLDKFDLYVRDKSQLLLVMSCGEGIIYVDDKEYSVQHCVEKSSSQPIILSINKGGKTIILRERL